MYKINGWFPVVRCVCGKKHLLVRAVVCQCGATLRFRKGRRGTVRPYGLAPDNYNFAAQPHKCIRVVDWQEAV